MSDARHRGSLETEEQPPRVSIVLLALNQLVYNRLCVESVLTHSDVPFELILVDNGSTDGTTEYFRAIAAKDTRVRLVANQENLGFATGCNEGLAIARGEIVLFLNNDTVVPRNWLSRLLAHLDTHPDVGLVGPISNYVTGQQKLPEIPFPNHPDAMPQILEFGELLHEAGAGQGFEIPRLIGFCLAVRREVIDRLGGFDPQFGNGNFEDDDFCLRARAAGFKLWVAQDVYVHHFGNRTFAGMGGQESYQEAMKRGWEIFKSKWNATESEGGGYRTSVPPYSGKRHHVALPRAGDPLWYEQPDPFGPDARPYPLEGLRDTAFFHHPTWSETGWREVVAAYARAFRAEDPVSLVLWLDPVQGVSEAQAAGLIQDALEEAGIAGETADMLLVPEPLSRAGLAELYAACDCVVPAGDALQRARAEQVGREILADLAPDAWRAAAQERVGPSP